MAAEVRKLALTFQVLHTDSKSANCSINFTYLSAATKIKKYLNLSLTDICNASALFKFLFTLSKSLEIATQESSPSESDMLTLQRGR